MIEGARRLGRAVLLAFVRLLPEAKGGLISGPITSILVVRTDDRVGNLLLTTPLLAALREAFPTARLGLLCAAKRSMAVEGTALFDELWRFEKRDFFRRPWAFAALLWRLRRSRYQVAIEAGHFHAFSFTGAAIALWSGAPIRIGHRRGESARFLTHAVEKDSKVAYDAAAKLELLRPLGVSAALLPLRTELGKSGELAMRALIGKALVVNPGARKADHRWPAEAFAAAARAIAERAGLAVWVAWGPGEEGLARGVAEAVKGRLLPATNLEQLAAVFRAAALVLTNDTGPMHLAVAVGAPTIAVFLADDVARWAAPEPHFSAVSAAGRSADQVIEEVLQEAERLTAVSAAS